MKRKIFTALFFIAVPSMAFAFSLASNTFKGVITEILSVIYILIPILSTLAFVVFFWGLSKFILKSDNQKDIQAGKNYMLWGVLALFILLSFRAIIGFIVVDLDFGNGRNLPLLPSGQTETELPGSNEFPGSPAGIQ